MNGEDGELFEEGVVLARQYLGIGDWHVWDLRPNGGGHCKQCSSSAQRIVRHERGSRCPGATRGDDRVALARDAIARRAARLENDRVIEAALSRAQELDREAQAQAVAEDEGDDEEEAEAEAEEHGVAEERAHEEDAYVQSMVLSFFYYSFGMMCFLRAYRPRHPLHPFRPLRPLRPLLPLRPLP